MKYAILILALVSALLTQSCSTVAGGTAVFVAGKHAEAEEIRERRLNASKSCLFQHKDNPFLIAESIAYGDPITAEYQLLLNPGEPKEAFSKDPALPHYVAYALYLVAERLGDPRAAHKLEWLGIYFDEGETDRIQTYMAQKYMDSYLEKCFSRPVHLS